MYSFPEQTHGKNSETLFKTELNKDFKKINLIWRNELTRVFDRTSLKRRADSRDSSVAHIHTSVGHCYLRDILDGPAVCDDFYILAVLSSLSIRKTHCLQVA